MKDFWIRHSLHLWIGLGLLAFFQTALFQGIGPIPTYFYSFIWWSYILTVDGLVLRLRGESLLINRPRLFFALIPWSVTLWLVFEAFNLVLKNWHYVGLPKEMVFRWPGYFVAYGTVMPAIWETKDLLSALGLFEKEGGKKWPVSRSLYRPLIIAGVLCLLLPLMVPEIFFPLVWLGFVFLLEPFNHRTGRPSLLRDLEQGKPGNLYRLLLSGMILGLLWEFWNFWAKAKWMYTVPWVGEVKLFEMPVLGFFGFPPFAVECFVMIQFLGIGRPRPSGKGLGWRAIPLALLFFGVMFSAIDRYTVRSFAP
jgi:hypothetical protein